MDNTHGPSCSLASCWAAAQRALQMRHSSFRRLCTLSLRFTRQTGEARSRSDDMRNAPRRKSVFTSHIRTLLAKRRNAQMLNGLLVDNGHRSGAAVAGTDVPRQVHAEGVHEIVWQQRPDAAPSFGCEHRDLSGRSISGLLAVAGRTGAWTHHHFNAGRSGGVVAAAPAVAAHLRYVSAPHARTRTGAGRSQERDELRAS